MFRVIVNRAAFAAALQLVAATAPKRSPKPILLCVKLESGEHNVFKIGATDLESAVSITAALVQVESAGAVLVDFAALQKIVKADESATLSMEQTADARAADGEEPSRYLVIRDDDCTYKLFADHKVEDFPPIPEIATVRDVPLTPTFVIPANTLRTMLEQTEFCRAKEATRYSMNGVLIRNNGRTDIVATDGRRLAAAMTRIAGIDSADRKRIVPGAAIDALCKALKASYEQNPPVSVWFIDPPKDEKGNITTSADDAGQVVFSFDDGEPAACRWRGH